MKRPEIFIIIPVHNRKQYTQDCLKSLFNQSVQNFKTIVVDDGSTDGTSEMIRENFPEVILLDGDGNLWWSRATNLGVKYALEHGADYIMTLNDDTIAIENFIERMLFWAERKPKVLLGAFAVDAETEKPIYGGSAINWKTAKGTSLLSVIPPNERHGLHKVTHAPGRGLWIPREVFEKIGMFDDNHFPQSFADFDFTHRAHHAEYKIYCNYDAQLLIYPRAAGDVELREKMSFKNYFHHLFGIKGGGNLRFFVNFALRNCPRRYIISFLVLGLSRRLFGYLFDWIAGY